MNLFNAKVELEVPRQLEVILSKMLEENPSDRYDNLNEVIQELDKIKIPINKNEEIALASYERCCVANPDFTEDFYQKLFASSHHKEEMVGFFSKNPNPEKEEQRKKMLRVAIELLIQHEKEPDKLVQILGLDIHHGVGHHLYEAFMNTIISCVEDNDYLWKNYTEREVANPIKLAWGNIRDAILEKMRK